MSTLLPLRAARPQSAGDAGEAPRAEPHAGPARLLPWALLAALLAALLVAAVTFDRRGWPDFVGDETTYLMQAQSLAWDFDNRYTPADYQRFVDTWGKAPDGVILQSRDEGRTLVYAKPASYALAIAPLVRLAPRRGAAVANALLLAVTALAAALALSRRLGPAAPLWTAVWVFGSVAFAHVFWAHADLFLMCLVALALAFAYGGRRGAEGGAEADPPSRALLRWSLVGLLLGLVILARPFYAPLLLPAALAVPPGRRRAGLSVLAAGALIVTLTSTLGGLASRGSWTPYGGVRQSFDLQSGFPGVGPGVGAGQQPGDLQTRWQQQIASRGSRTWIAPEALQLKLDPQQTSWNLLYFLAGRHVGVLPYFLPLLLGLVAMRAGRGRWALLLAVLAACFLFLYVRPFNFYGGGGALANRYFLPLYPAFWFLAARPLRPRAGAAWAALAVLGAAPFLLPVWSHPRAFLLAPGGGYSYVSPAAQRLLPYETTLSHLKPGGQEDVIHEGFWVKLLTPTVRADPGGARLHLAPGSTGELLLGSPAPLPGLRLRLAPGQPAPLAVAGAEVAASRQRPDGGTTLVLRFDRPRARHRMWWTEDDVYLYQLRLTAPAGTPPGGAWTFLLLPESPPAGERGADG